tara:strand:- start:8475 stop:9260 length:786 start_codon:yes stop_codon:yes gene_type:complete
MVSEDDPAVKRLLELEEELFQPEPRLADVFTKESALYATVVDKGLDGITMTHVRKLTKELKAFLEDKEAIIEQLPPPIDPYAHSDSRALRDCDFGFDDAAELTDKAIKELDLAAIIPSFEDDDVLNFFLLADGTLLTFNGMHAEAVAGLGSACGDSIECFCDATGAMRVVMTHKIGSKDMDLFINPYCHPTGAQADRLNPLVLHFNSQGIKVFALFSARDADSYFEGDADINPKEIEWGGHIRNIYDVPAFKDLRTCPRYS